MSDKRVFIDTHASLGELVRSIEARPIQSAFIGDESSKTGGESFCGTKTYEEARDLLRNGWDEPLADIKSAIAKNDKVNKTQKVTRSQVRHSMAGGSPSVARHLSGHPMQMRRVVKPQLPQKTVYITYDICETGGTDKAELTKCGTVILEAVNHLERLGYRVRLDVCDGRSESSEVQVMRVCVKDYRQPVDLHKLCFPVAHPSMLRRIGFKHTETNPNLVNPRNWPCGYGRVLSRDAEATARVRDVMEAEGSTLIQTTDVRSADYGYRELLVNVGILKADAE